MVAAKAGGMMSDLVAFVILLIVLVMEKGEDDE
jgi:hypothetical protein